MAFNLNDFRNKLVNGGARPSQFEMQITWPDIVRGSASVASAERDFRFLCSVSEIPASTVGNIPVNYFGRKLFFAGDRSFGTLSVTVLNDEDFKIRKAMETWMRAITGHTSTSSQFVGGNISGSYATDGIVTQFSRNAGGAATHAYKFVGMFPTSLAAIPLSWEQADQFETFTIEFHYQWWETIDATSGASLSVNL